MTRFREAQAPTNVDSPFGALQRLFPPLDHADAGEQPAQLYDKRRFRVGIKRAASQS